MNRLFQAIPARYVYHSASLGRRFVFLDFPAATFFSKSLRIEAAEVHTEYDQFMSRIRVMMAVLRLGGGGAAVQKGALLRITTGGVCTNVGS